MGVFQVKGLCSNLCKSHGNHFFYCGPSTKIIGQNTNTEANCHTVSCRQFFFLFFYREKENRMNEREEIQ